jgi:hypothetical protein
VRDRFDVVRKIDASAIPSLRRVAVRKAYSNSNMSNSQLTSGDSSDRITAPRVSTWIILGDGKEGAEEEEEAIVGTVNMMGKGEKVESP